MTNISDVTRLNENGLEGGIEDLGNFKEGFCFSARGKNADDKENFKWIMCAEDYDSKCDLMKRMIALKLKLQIACSNTQEDKEAFNQMSGNLEVNSQSPLWITLSDWAQCDSKCGGGNQNMTRYCLKSATDPVCDGNSTVTRTCNDQPCTPIKEEIIKSELLPPEIRIIPISTRPQKYSKCIIKEEDMEISRTDMCTAGNSQPPLIPTRVILTSDKISVMKGESLNSYLISYKLQDLKLIQPLKDQPKKCLKFGINENQSTVMCAMNDKMLHDKFNVEINPVQKWIADILEFRDECNVKFIKPNYEKDPRVCKLIELLKEQEVSHKIEKIHLISQQKQEKQGDLILKLAQLKAYRTLQKELKFDERLEKEELMREQKEEEEIKTEYLMEEEKKKKLLTSYLSLNTEKEKIQNKNKIKEKLSEIDQDLKSKLFEHRKVVLKKINLLRMAHERKSKKVREKITNMKGEITSELTNAQKEGDATKCMKAVKMNNFIQYCIENFVDKTCTIKECASKNNFCLVCCEFQVGEFLLEQREDCLNKCVG